MFTYLHNLSWKYRFTYAWLDSLVPRSVHCSVPPQVLALSACGKSPYQGLAQDLCRCPTAYGFGTGHRQKQPYLWSRTAPAHTDHPYQEAGLLCRADTTVSTVPPFSGSFPIRSYPFISILFLVSLVGLRLLSWLYSFFPCNTALPNRATAAACTINRNALSDTISRSASSPRVICFSPLWNSLAAFHRT